MNTPRVRLVCADDVAAKMNFEAWAKAEPRDWNLELQQDLDAWPGQYTEYHVQCAWEAWIENTRQSREQREFDDSLTYISDNFLELVTRFVERFILVFDQDWDFTESQFSHLDDHINGTGTFCFPQVDSEDLDNNWANRGALLWRFYELHDFLKSNRLYSTEFLEEMNDPMLTTEGLAGKVPKTPFR